MHMYIQSVTELIWRHPAVCHVNRKRPGLLQGHKHLQNPIVYRPPEHFYGTSNSTLTKGDPRPGISRRDTTVAIPIAKPSRKQSKALGTHLRADNQSNPVTHTR